MASESRTYPCNTCSKTYSTSAEQREHMRGEWHISNLRRKVAGEAAQNEEEYYQDHRAPARKSPVPTVRPHAIPTTIKKRSPSPPTTPTIRPTNCLFCTHASSTIGENLAHMSTAHGLRVPSIDRITHLVSFLTYLATIVYEWHECLYCGVEKGNTRSVQTHMRDKGHCKVDEDEVDDFLEQEEDVDESAEGKKLSETEWRLPSGAIINARSDSTSSPRAALLRTKRTVHRGGKRDEEKQLAITDSTANPTPSPASSSSGAGALAVRNSERSLAGVSKHQVRALVATEKKMKTQAALAEARSKQRLVREPVLTKYYKTENPVYQAG